MLNVSYWNRDVVFIGEFPDRNSGPVIARACKLLGTKNIFATTAPFQTAVMKALASNGFRPVAFGDRSLNHRPGHVQLWKKRQRKSAKADEMFNHYDLAQEDGYARETFFDELELFPEDFRNTFCCGIAYAECDYQEEADEFPLLSLFVVKPEPFGGLKPWLIAPGLWAIGRRGLAPAVKKGNKG